MRTDATPRQGSQGKEPPDLFPLLPFRLQGRTESSHNPAGERGQGPHHPESASMGIDQEEKYREWVRGDKGGFKGRHINSRQGANPQGLLNLVEYDPLPPSGLPVDPSPTPPAASARGIHGQKAHRQLSYTQLSVVTSFGVLIPGHQRLEEIVSRKYPGHINQMALCPRSQLPFFLGIWVLDAQEPPSMGNRNALPSLWEGGSWLLPFYF